MAKLTDEKKWADAWFRSLAPEFKLAWLYLLDNVDLAGVIELDRELAEFQIRAHVDWERFLAESGGRIRKLASGKLWIPKAARFQIGMPGVLNPKNTFHLGIKKQLEKHALWGVFEELFPSCCVKIQQGPTKALPRPSVAPTKAHEGEGEGEEQVFSDATSSQKSKNFNSDSSQKRKLSSNSNSAQVVTGEPAAEPVTTAAASAGASGEAQEGPTLPLRDGTPYRVPATILDKARGVYGAELDLVVETGKAELWLITNPHRRPATPKGMGKFLVAWFARADEMQRKGRSAHGPPAPAAPGAGLTLGQQIAARLEAKQGVKR